MNQETGRASRFTLLAFLAVALYGCYVLVQPFLEPIVLAILVGLLAHPLHHRLVSTLRGRESAAALLSCLGLCLVVVIPLLVLMVAVLDQGIRYSIAVREWATADNVGAVMSNPTVVRVRDWLTDLLPAGALEAENLRSRALALASTLGGKFASTSTAMLGSVTQFFINIVLFLFLLFFVLRDHDRLVDFLRRALPLSRSQEDLLFTEVRQVSKSALMGSFLTACTQGVVGGIGLWIAGIPGLFWGAVMAFTSLIPFVGTAIIWVPAALYLAFVGEFGWAIFLALWGVIVVGSIDNFLRPMLMQDASMNTVVVFFSLIGGLQVFGLMGLVYGPLIFSIALVLFRLYEEEFARFLTAQDRK